MPASVVVPTPTLVVCATMACAIADLARRGFTADLRAVDGALRAATGETLWPQDLVIREVHRFEGVAFGVYADPTTGVALHDVPIRPSLAS